jgi:hypothetical protein
MHFAGDEKTAAGAVNKFRSLGSHILRSAPTAEWDLTQETLRYILKPLFGGSVLLISDCDVVQSRDELRGLLKMARLSEFHQLLGLVMHSLDLPNQHISSVVIGSRQLAEEQRCGKSEASFLREFVHQGHIASAANR